MSNYNGNAKSNVNVGLAANDGTGDPLRTAFQKVNNNFFDLYVLLGNGNYLGNVTQINIFGGNITGVANIATPNVIYTGNLSTPSIFHNSGFINVKNNFNITANLDVENKTTLKDLLVTQNVTVVSNVTIRGNSNTLGYAIFNNVIATGNSILANLELTGETTVSGNIVGYNIRAANSILPGGSVVESELGRFTSNVSVGNLITDTRITTSYITVTGSGNTFSTSGNITSGNLINNYNITTNSLNVSGNITTGNISISSGAIFSTLTSTGNISTGNLSSLGRIITTTLDVSSNTTTSNINNSGRIITTTLDASANVTTGNINNSGRIITNSLQGSGSSLLVNNNVSITGNLTVLGITSIGTVAQTGNVQFGNVSVTGRISSGTLDSSIIFPPSGVSAGPIGNTTHHVGLVIDSSGRITLSNAIPISAGVSGLGGFFPTVSNIAALAVTTTSSNIFIAPSTPVTDRYLVYSIHVTNIDNDFANVGLISATVGGQNYNLNSLANSIPVPVSSAVELLKKPKILQPGDYITLESNINATLHASLTYQTLQNDNTYFGTGVDYLYADEGSYVTLYQSTGNASVIESILLVNDSVSNDTRSSIVYTDASNNIIGYYAFRIIVPLNSTIELLETPKYLPANYKIRLNNVSGERIEAVISGRKI